MACGHIPDATEIVAALRPSSMNVGSHYLSNKTTNYYEIVEFFMLIYLLILFTIVLQGYLAENGVVNLSRVQRILSGRLLAL